MILPIFYGLKLSIGLEPTTFSLRVRRTTNCAKRASFNNIPQCNYLSKKFSSCGRKCGRKFTQFLESVYFTVLTVIIILSLRVKWF